MLLSGGKGGGAAGQSMEPLLRERSTLQSAHKSLDSVLGYVGGATFPGDRPCFQCACG